MFHNSKITIYQIIVLIFQFAKKGSTKNTSALVGISNKTAAERSKCMRNVCTRLLLKLDMTMGGRNERVQLDETHFFSIPKHHRGRWRKHRNWLFVVVDEDSTLFYCQLVRKRTRPALETIINQIVKPGTHIKSDEHKACYWLGKTTKKSVPAMQTGPLQAHYGLP